MDHHFLDREQSLLSNGSFFFLDDRHKFALAPVTLENLPSEVMEPAELSKIIAGYSSGLRILRL